MLMLTPDYSVYSMWFHGVHDFRSKMIQDVAQSKCKLGWRASIRHKASYPTRHPVVQPYQPISSTQRFPQLRVIPHEHNVQYAC